MKDPQIPATEPESVEPGAPVESPLTPDGWRPLGIADLTARAPEAVPPEPCRRRDERIHARLPASTTFIDPVRDPVTNELCYLASDEDAIFSLSRRGAGMICERPPLLGTRLLVQIRAPEERTPIEMVGRTCWTRVRYVTGEHGARAVAAVGVEFIGGTRRALDRYERWLAGLADATESLVATPEATG